MSKSSSNDKPKPGTSKYRPATIDNDDLESDMCSKPFSDDVKNMSGA